MFDRPNVGSPVFRLAVTGVLLVLLLASLIYLGTRFFDSSSGDPSLSKAGQVLTGESGASSLASERQAVMSQSSKFISRLNTFGPDDLDDDGKTLPEYRTRVEELASAKMGKEFVKDGLPLAEATVSQQGAGREAEVYATGVAAIDSDTATVLVTGQMEFSYPKSKKSDERSVVDRQLFRYTVELVKSDGEWLVDAWEPAAKPPADESDEGLLDAPDGGE